MWGLVLGLVLGLVWGAGVGIGSGVEDAPPPPPQAVKTSIEIIVINFLGNITLMLGKALHL